MRNKTKIKRLLSCIAICVLLVVTICATGTSCYSLLVDIAGIVDDYEGDDSDITVVTKEYYMGEVATIGKLDYTIIDVYDTAYIGSAYLGETTQNNFVVVRLKITNNANKSVTLYDDMFKYCRDSFRYESSYSGIYLENGFYVCEELGAGLSITINVVYEIPSEHISTDYILAKESSYSSKGVKIYLSNK